MDTSHFIIKVTQSLLFKEHGSFPPKTPTHIYTHSKEIFLKMGFLPFEIPGADVIDRNIFFSTKEISPHYMLQLNFKKGLSKPYNRLEGEIRSSEKLNNFTNSFFSEYFACEQQKYVFRIKCYSFQHHWFGT